MHKTMAWSLQFLDDGLLSCDSPNNKQPSHRAAYLGLVNLAPDFDVVATHLLQLGPHAVQLHDA